MNKPDSSRDETLDTPGLEPEAGPAAMPEEANDSGGMSESTGGGEGVGGEAAQGVSPDSTARPRKERVLHTRIPEVLETELKHLATSLRVPVSNLVRTILEDAIGAAELVGRAAEQELRGAADRLARNRGKLQGAATLHGAQLGRAARRPPAQQPVAPSVVLTDSEGALPAEGGASLPACEGASTPVGAAASLPADDARPTAIGVAAATSSPVASATSVTPVTSVEATLFEGVLGYQSIILALDSRCARCQKPLAVGEEAYLGVRDAPGPRVIIGPECLPGASR